MEPKTQYWIVAVSKDYLAHGIKGGYMQANDGKEAILEKLEQGDWILFYSPKETEGGNKILQAFTGIGQVADGEIYQYNNGDGFKPYRRKVIFYKCQDVKAESVINQLDFVKNKSNWEPVFRFGFFEIPEADFRLIKAAMINDSETEKIE